MLETAVAIAQNGSPVEIDIAKFLHIKSADPFFLNGSAL